MPDNAGLLLIAMVFIVVPQIAMIWVKGQDEYSFRILGFTILAFLGVFSGLVVSNSDNATGVFGLLGVIAGYVIGKKVHDALFLLAYLKYNFWRWRIEGI